MKEFKPSSDFVERVMRGVHAYDASQAARVGLVDRFMASTPFRYAVSGCGVFFGIFFSASVCV